MKIYNLTEDVTTDKLLKLTFSDLEKLNKIFEAGKEIKTAGIMIGIKNERDISYNDVEEAKNIVEENEEDFEEDSEDDELPVVAIDKRSGKKFYVLSSNRFDDRVVLEEIDTGKEKTIKYKTFKSHYRVI